MKIFFLMFRWTKEQYGRRQKLILNQLGLTERGDIIWLKAFAVEKSENKKKLAELITNAEKERPVWKKVTQKKQWH